MEMLLNSTSVDKIFNNDDFANLFVNLAWRWLDESDYEDIKDYAAPLEKKIAEILGVNVDGELKMTKRPFGFKMNCNFSFTTKSGMVKILPAVVQFKITASGSMSWTAKPIIK